MTIRVHVERLVLEGLELSLAERGVLERGVVAELTRLLGGGDAARALTRIYADGATLATLHAPQLQFVPGESPAALGTLLGRSACHALLPTAGVTAARSVVSSPTSDKAST